MKKKIIGITVGTTMNPDKFGGNGTVTDGLATEEYVDDAVAAEEEARKKDVNRAIEKIPTKVSAFENDKGYLTEHQSLDNYYTKSEVTTELNKKQDTLDKYVKSVNGYSGEVTLAASDVKALPDSTVIPTVPNVVSAFTNDADYASKTYVSEIASGKCQAFTFDTVADLDTWLTNAENTTNLNNGDVFYIRAVGVPDYWWDKEKQCKQILETTKVELDDYAKTGDIPTKTSQLTNDSGYIATSEVDTKLGGKQDKLTQYVSSVNGKSGDVNLNILSEATNGYDGAITSDAEGIAKVGYSLDFYWDSDGKKFATRLRRAYNENNTITLSPRTGIIVLGDKPYFLQVSSEVPTDPDSGIITFVI